MVLSNASEKMEIMEIMEMEESTRSDVPLDLCMKRKRSSSEHRRRKVKKGEADNDEFIFQTEATIGLFELQQSPDEYVTNIVNPLLRQGQDTHLYRWLYHMLLLKTPGRCTVPHCIGSPMKLKVYRRGKDKAAWEPTSPDCKHRLSMRTGSFFAPLKCDLSQAISVIREWCSNTPMTETCSMHNEISEGVIKRVYQQCLEVVETFVGRYTREWQLGGPGSVVLIDLWPNGFSSVQEPVSSPTKRRGEKVRILWLADTNYLPVRYWAQVLPAVSPSTKGLKGDAKKEDKRSRHEEFVSTVAELAENHIVPGSLLLVNEKSLPGVGSALAESNSYEAVTSLDSVLQADCDGHQTTKSILDNIWGEASRLCFTLQPMSRVGASRHLSHFLWRQRFATSNSEAFLMMLRHIASLYKPPTEVPGETCVPI